MRILNLEPDNCSPTALGILRQLGEVSCTTHKRDELLKVISNYDVLIVRIAHQIDREIIDQGKRLKVIVTATTGLDHIDVVYAESKGIDVLSLYGETEFLRTIKATAEHTWALLMALIRRIPQAFRSVMAGEWNRDRFRGNELSGKQLGILGLGRVGRQVAAYGRAFDMRVCAFDPYVKDWIDWVEREESLDALLKRSDILSLHLPLNNETFGMIGRSALQQLPAGALVINTSRGGILVESELVEMLNSGHVNGAAIDVVQFERDPNKRNASPLISYACHYDNLLITPHIAGATRESMTQTEIFMANKLLRYFRESRGRRIVS